MKIDKVAIAKHVAESLKDKFNELVDNAVVDAVPEEGDDSVDYELISDIAILTFKILAGNTAIEDTVYFHKFNLFPEPHASVAAKHFEDEYAALNAEFGAICEEYDIKPNLHNRATLQARITDKRDAGEIDEATAAMVLHRIKTWGVSNIRLFEQVDRKVYS